MADAMVEVRKRIKQATKTRCGLPRTVPVSFHWNDRHQPDTEQVPWRELETYVLKTIDLNRNRLRLVKIGTVDIWRPPQPIPLGRR